MGSVGLLHYHVMLGQQQEFRTNRADLARAEVGFMREESVGCRLPASHGSLGIRRPWTSPPLSEVGGSVITALRKGVI